MGEILGAVFPKAKLLPSYVNCENRSFKNVMVGQTEDQKFHLKKGEKIEGRVDRSQETPIPSKAYSIES